MATPGRDARQTGKSIAIMIGMPGPSASPSLAPGAPMPGKGKKQNKLADPELCPTCGQSLPAPNSGASA